jgi:hypothetical protein
LLLSAGWCWHARKPLVGVQSVLLLALKLQRWNSRRCAEKVKDYHASLPSDRSLPIPFDVKALQLLMWMAFKQSCQ